jgi:hypothetical protein
MKKAMITGMLVAIMALSASLWAADDASQAKSGDEQKQVMPEKPRSAQMRERGMMGRGGRDPNAMQQMVQDGIERRKQEHQATIKELEEIKKIAESEKATKTAEAIQKMIDAKDAAFKKQVAEVEKRRAEMMEKRNQRMQESAGEAKGKKK